MVGGSYGGGIQLVTAATDCRIDAIVPTIAWHSLTTSLDKADTAKSGWSGILTNLTSSEHVDPEVMAAYRSGVVEGAVTPAELAWFAARGPAQLLHDIHVPTLIVQGTVDTLFTLQEGVDNYEALRANGVTTSMRWFCGGHGVCLTPTGDPGATEQATLAWLAALRAARHVGRHRTRVQLRRPERHHLLGPDLPLAPGDAVSRQRFGHPGTGGDGWLRPHHRSIRADQAARQPGRLHHPRAGHQCGRRTRSPSPGPG